MMGRWPVAGALGAALVLTAGCTSRPLDVFEEPKDLVVIGAKSRHIATIAVDPRSEPGHVRPKKVICAEPSPDTVSAVAQSLTAAFQAAAQVQQPQAQVQGAGTAAAQFGRSVSEGLIQMTERTQTIQLLRDSLYRACEAYANGALSDTAYAMLLSRYDDTMVTMLTAELAAGAFGRTPGAISSEAQHTLKDLANELKAAQEQFRKAPAGPHPGNGNGNGNGNGGSHETSAAQPTGPESTRGAAQRVDVQPLPALPSARIAETRLAQAVAPAAPQAPQPDQQPAGAGQADAPRAAAPAAAAQPPAAAPAAAPANPQAVAAAERRSAATAQFAQAAGALMGGAKVVATAGGGLNPQPTPQLADKLIQLHERFSEGGGREAFLVACLNALDRRDGKTGLVETCKQFLSTVTSLAEKHMQAKAQVESNVELAKAKARFDYQLRHAQIRAGVLTDMVKFCTGSGHGAADSAQCNELLKSVKDIFNTEFAAIDARPKQ
jgi:hypothetical protein